MIRELDLVTLATDVEDHRLQRGDVGSVVHCYASGEAYEVEFVTAEGKSIAVLTLKAADISPLHGAQILHIRELNPT
jgi:hypothetical protein